MNAADRLKFLRVALIVFGLIFLVGVYPLTIVWPAGQRAAGKDRRLDDRAGFRRRRERALEDDTLGVYRSAMFGMVVTTPLWAAVSS